MGDRGRAACALRRQLLSVCLRRGKASGSPCEGSGGSSGRSGVGGCTSAKARGRGRDASRSPGAGRPVDGAGTVVGANRSLCRGLDLIAGGAERMAGSKPQGVPRTLGITGPIGCGKTTVGDMLLELGALERIDADRVVHGLMAPNSVTTKRVRETFGDGVMASDGSVDRSALASVVFSKPDRLRALEAIVHPAVREAIRSRIA